MTGTGKQAYGEQYSSIMSPVVDKQSMNTRDWLE